MSCSNASRSRWPPFQLAAAALMLAASLIAACSAPEPQPYYDLIDRFSTAELVAAPGGGTLNRPVVDSKAGHVFLPAGSSVSFAFFAEPGSTIASERIAVRGESTELSLTVETDGAEPHSYALTRSQRSWSQSLGLSEPEPARLTFRVEADDPQPGDGALLTRPIISGLIEDSPPEVLASADPAKQPNIIIYLMDTLRRDRLGVYGYERPVSPEVDAFAREATVFSSGHGQSSWTKPSVASLFTGVWPPRHGMLGGKHILSDKFATLAEILQDAGWITSGFVTNINLYPQFNLHQGFETYWYKSRERSAVVNESVFEWLEAYDRSRPLFLYVHTLDPHSSYNPGEPFRSMFAPTADDMPQWKPRWKWPLENLPFFNDLYDGEIAQNDASFGAFLDQLRDMDLYDDSLVIFLSDHGEEFQERGGWRHGRRLHAETLDMPLIVKFPGQRTGRRSDVPVSHIDILPTVLDIAGLPPIAGAEGQSLASPTPRPIYSHLDLGRHPVQYSVVVGTWKLIRLHGETVSLELYDIDADPRETHDLADRMPVRTATMVSLLDAKLTETGTAESEESELSEETERELRALGYLG